LFRFNLREQINLSINILQQYDTVEYNNSTFTGVCFSRQDDRITILIANSITAIMIIIIIIIIIIMVVMRITTIG